LSGRVLNYEFTNIPECKTNSKITLLINENITKAYNTTEITYEVSITADIDGFWSELKIYSMSEKEFLHIGIKEIEKRMVKIWEVTHSAFSEEKAVV
jgi:hypothetical protein